MAKKNFFIPTSLTRKFPGLQKFSWLLEAGIVRSLIGMLRMMSPQRAYRFANGMFRFLKPVLPFSKKIRENLSTAFPEKSAPEIESLVRDVCGNLGKTAVDLVLAKRIFEDPDQQLEYVVAADVDLNNFKGKPAVMISGHIGPWQIGTFLATHFELPVTSVYAPEQNPYLVDFFKQMRGELGVNFISRDGCMRPLTKELKQGRLVGLVADTRMPGGVPVTFFGKTTTANTAAARLALRHNCPLFPSKSERLGGMKFKITLDKAILPDDPEAPVSEQAAQMTQKMFTYFEQVIRADPAHWMCFSRRWPKAENPAETTAPDN